MDAAPPISTDDLVSVGVDAAVRWHQDQLGWMSPVEELRTQVAVALRHLLDEGLVVPSMRSATWARTSPIKDRAGTPGAATRGDNGKCA